jgi:hypothetical protein
MKKLNKQVQEEYISSLEESNKLWKALAHDFSDKYWELKAKIEGLEKSAALWRDLAHGYADDYWKLRLKEAEKCSKMNSDQPQND